jgi:hypothetical protein
MINTNPKLESDGWELESAVVRHQKNPATFHIPPEQERANLPVGAMAQLLFLIAGEDEDGSYIQCEKMWVTVRRVTNTGYVGMLESMPLTSEVLKPEDEVAFAAEHVASVLVRRNDTRHPDYESA